MKADGELLVVRKVDSRDRQIIVELPKRRSAIETVKIDEIPNASLNGARKSRRRRRAQGENHLDGADKRHKPTIAKIGTSTRRFAWLVLDYARPKGFSFANEYSN